MMLHSSSSVSLSFSHMWETDTLGNVFVIQHKYRTASSILTVAHDFFPDETDRRKFQGKFTRHYDIRSSDLKSFYTRSL